MLVRFAQALVKRFLLLTNAIFRIEFVPHKHTRDQVVLAPVDLLDIVQLAHIVRLILIRDVFEFFSAFLRSEVPED